MATCKECLHIECCDGYMPTDLDEDVWDMCKQGKADEIPDIEERCNAFKERTNYVEVVRCKDCTRGELYFNRPSYIFCMEHHRLVEKDDYCSYGERKDNG